MKCSREKSPDIAPNDHAYPVTNYNQYNIYSEPVTNNFVEKFLIQPEQVDRKRSFSVVSN